MGGARKGARDGPQPDRAARRSPRRKKAGLLERHQTLNGDNKLRQGRQGKPKGNGFTGVVRQLYQSEARYVPIWAHAWQRMNMSGNWQTHSFVGGTKESVLFVSVLIGGFLAKAAFCNC